MKKYLPLLFLSVFCSALSAQDFLTGKLTDPQWGARQVFYDRTQNGINSSIFQTVYKVFETDKTPLYSITITHDNVKGIIIMAVKQIGGNSKGTTLTYDLDEHGLIFTERGSFDTSFANIKSNKYLLSFTGEPLDYPLLHEAKTEDGKILELDPLSKLRIRKQTDAVKNYVPEPSAMKEPVPAATPATTTPEIKKATPVTDKAEVKAVTNKTAPSVAMANEKKTEKAGPVSELTFNRHLLLIRDSLYRMNSSYTQRISELRNVVDAEIATRFESRQFERDAKDYSGDKHSGHPEGKGVLIENGNVFEGNFTEGVFWDGRVVLRYDAFSYTGEFSSDTFNGIGWIKYKNGSYMLGSFHNGELVNGVSMNKETTGEVYFGSCRNNVRNGYGELHNQKGGMYFGEFIDGKLVSGYAKEVDPFGYATYSKIYEGNKSPVNAALAEDFFDSVLSAKK